MQTVLFGAYQLVGTLLFLFLTAVMLYHRRLTRWLKFSVGFIPIHVLGSLVFFGRVPSHMAELFSTGQFWVKTGAIILLLFGPFAVLGWALVKGFTAKQATGALLIFAAAMGALVTVLHLALAQQPANIAWPR